MNINIFSLLRYVGSTSDEAEIAQPLSSDQVSKDQQGSKNTNAEKTTENYWVYNTYGSIVGFLSNCLNSVKQKVFGTPEVGMDDAKENPIADDAGPQQTLTKPISSSQDNDTRYITNSTNNNETVNDQADSSQNINPVEANTDSTSNAETVNDQSGSSQNINPVEANTDSTSNAETINDQADSTENTKSSSKSNAETINDQADSTENTKSSSTNNAETVNYQSGSSKNINPVEANTGSTNNAETANDQPGSNSTVYKTENKTSFWVENRFLLVLLLTASSLLVGLMVVYLNLIKTD